MLTRLYIKVIYAFFMESNIFQGYFSSLFRAVKFIAAGGNEKFSLRDLYAWEY